MNTISVDTLRAWLEEQQPVTILDVRPQQDYAEWCIPGSIHVDAYEALKAHDPAALFGVDLPTDQPVVTVCGVGKTSQIAAEQLQARGVRALFLEGGMQAWSLTASTLAEIDEQVGLLHATRATFVRTTLSRIPPTPPNYARIVRLNEAGALPEGDPTELEAGANRCAIS